ncbi:MAG: transglutaminaseTgpA domain-containing protein, partial [Oscillospiraceae bacterium]
PLGWAVVRRRAFWPVLLLTLPWLIPIFLAEFPPDVVSLSLLAACWITLLLSGLTARTNPVGAARLTLTALPAALLVLCWICLLFPVEDYVYPDWAANTAQKLTELGERAAEPVLVGGNTSGAPSSVDLTRCGPRRFTGRPVLSVESDWTGRLYLRGAAYADYTGGSWEQLSDEAQAELDEIGLDTSSYFALARGAGAQIYSAAITHLDGSSRMAYYPYQPADLSAISGGVRYAADSYLRLEEPQGTYTVEFSDSYLMLDDEAYRQFVYEHYLNVPEELADVLADVWEEEEILIPVSSPHAYKIALAREIADLLETTTEYDLQTPVTPEGEDFVAYFLTESHRGYCVHYASAAVMLLRMQGIPARYVSGYTVQVEDGEARVPDSAAHAWVEIYLDGLGWYPVEATPAAAFSDTSTEEVSPTVSDPAGEPKPSAEPSAAPTPSRSPTPTEKPSQNPGRNGAEGPGTTEEGPADLRWLGFAAVVLVLLGLPVLVRALRRRRWNRLTTLPDHNR